MHCEKHGEQKKCPPGLKPYMGAYDAKCLCIKEAE